MEFFYETLEKVNELGNFNGKVELSSKSAASYLYITIDGKYDYKIRFAGHDAIALNSKSDLELDHGFSFDWKNKNLTTTWGWCDYAGLECESDEVDEFTTADTNEMSNYMAALIVKEINRLFK